ncbi:MAG: hypothetical protein AAFO07_23740 [Bacteroidota bacterium]
MKNIIAAILLAFLCTPVIMQAQVQSEEVQVIKDFDARIIKTEKYKLNPALPPLDTSSKAQRYDVIARMLNVQYLPPKVRPTPFRGEALDDIYNGYAKLGGGFPKAFYGDAGYALLNENIEFKGNLFFNSADNSTNVENQKYSDLDFDLGGTYFFDQGYAVNANLGFESNNFFLYGYNEINAEQDRNISFAPEDVKQHFRTIDVGASIFNGLRTEADFNYEASFDFYRLTDNYASKESGLVLNFMGRKWFEEAHSLTVNVTTDFTSYQDTASQNLNNIFLNPAFHYHSDFFQVKVGINIASHKDDFSFFPDVEVSASLLDQVLTAFVGADGTLHKNNFQNLSDYNPFITSRPILNNTSYVHLYGGVKGEYQGINYNAQVGYKRANDLALFLADGDTIPRFDVVYDTVDVFTISGSVALPLLDDKLKIIGSFAQHIYSPNREDKAWHLPSTEINAEAQYKLMEDKLTVKGSVFVENGVPFRNLDGTSSNLSPLIDINAGADFQFTDQFGGFIQINNLLDNNRQRWRYHPILGINGVVGLTARF